MFNELLFHAAILMITAMITVLPANYFLLKYRNNSVIFRTRRDIFRPWIIMSSVYMGYVGRIHFTLTIGLILALAWFLAISMLVYLPSVAKQSKDRASHSWIYRLNKWLQYPENN